MASTGAEAMVLQCVVIEPNEEARTTIGHDAAASYEPPSGQPMDDREAPAQSWFRQSKSRIVNIATKVAAIASLLLTALMAWPAVSSAGDTHLATLLAEWTAQKEFFEFCEAHNWELDDCPRFKDTVLPPPPVKPALFRRLLDFRVPELGYSYRRHILSDNGTYPWSIDVPGTDIPPTTGFVSIISTCYIALFCLLLVLRSLPNRTRSLFTRLRGGSPVTGERRPGWDQGDEIDLYNIAPYRVVVTTTGVDLDEEPNLQGSCMSGADSYGGWSARGVRLASTTTDKDAGQGKHLQEDRVHESFAAISTSGDLGDGRLYCTGCIMLSCMGADLTDDHWGKEDVLADAVFTEDPYLRIDAAHGETITTGTDRGHVTTWASRRRHDRRTGEALSLASLAGVFDPASTYTPGEDWEH